MNLYRLTSTYGENEHGYGLGNNDTMYWGHVEKVGGPVYRPGPKVSSFDTEHLMHMDSQLADLLHREYLVEVGEDITP